MILVSVDPGLRECGVAVFDSGDLVWAGLASNPEESARGPVAWRAMAQAVCDAYPLMPDVLVIEQQQRDSRMFNPDHMFEVAGVTGCIVGMLGVVPTLLQGYKPREWSKVPKDVRHARLLEAMSDAANELVEFNGALTHNTLDAICLGRFYLERQHGRH